jgi:hypothetical protein
MNKRRRKVDDATPYEVVEDGALADDDLVVRDARLVLELPLQSDGGPEDPPGADRYQSEAGHELQMVGHRNTAIDTDDDASVIPDRFLLEELRERKRNQPVTRRQNVRHMAFGRRSRKRRAPKVNEIEPIIQFLPPPKHRGERGQLCF